MIPCSYFRTQLVYQLFLECCDDVCTGLHSRKSNVPWGSLFVKMGVQPFLAYWANWKTSNYMLIFLLLMFEIKLLVVIITVLKWSTVKVACVFGWPFCFHLFCGCCGLPCTCTCSCPSASNAVDWVDPDVWVDIHTLLPIVWKLSTLDI